MNDRFRLRAWNKEEKEMYYDVEGQYDNGCNGMGTMDHQCLTDLLEDERYIVEQCTGLKDKNGRLIYEGDIVLLDDTDSFENPIKTVVRWAKGNASFGLFRSHNLYYGFSSYESENFEVIGNIHEHGGL